MVFVLSALVAFGILAMRNRVNALAVLVGCLPLYLVRFFVGPIPSTLLEGMIVILFVVWVIEKRGIGGAIQCVQMKVSRASRAEKALYLFLYLFVLASTVSVAFSPAPRAALGVWRAYIVEPALFLMVFLDTITTRAHLWRVLSASILSGTLIAVLAVYQKLTGWNIPAPWVAERRVTSIYPYPNAVGLYLAPIVWFALLRCKSLFTDKKNALAIGACLAAALMVVAIIFSKTEAALVALVVTAGGAGLLWSGKTRIGTIGVVTLFVLVILSFPRIAEPVTDKLLLRDWSGSVRVITWKETVEMLKNVPLTGAGLGGYQTAMQPYHTATYLEIFLYPHNIFLNFWSETGIVGLIMFLFACAALFLLLYQVWRRSRDRILTYMIGAALATIFVHGLVDVPYFKNDLAVQFWFLIGATGALNHFTTKTSS